MYNDYLIPAIIAFIISAVLGPVLIPLLLKIKAGQTVRDDGPQSHLAKNGTPTMGGFIFLIAFFVSCIVYMIFWDNSAEHVAVMVCVLGFGIIGFIDDYIKVVLKRSLGLRAWQKFLLQTVFAIGYVVYVVNVVGVTTLFTIPFFNTDIDFGWFAYVALVIALLGTVNGANFTDGVDGLATSVTIAIGMFFVLAGAATDSYTTASSAIMVGALLGFLLYNSHKASVFMGDTGSLSLGGFVAGTAIVMQLPIYIIIIAFIYLAEVLSVIIQVGYFKLTKGKRVFRMAPIHHHFELGGWKETKVVAVFTIITVILCAIALIGM